MRSSAMAVSPRGAGPLVVLTHFLQRLLQVPRPLARFWGFRLLRLCLPAGGIQLGDEPLTGFPLRLQLGPDALQILAGVIALGLPTAGLRPVFLDLTAQRLQLLFLGLDTLGPLGGKGLRLPDIALLRAANVAMQRYREGVDDAFLFVVCGACDEGAARRRAASARSSLRASAISWSARRK